MPVSLSRSLFLSFSRGSCARGPRRGKRRCVCCRRPRPQKGRRYDGWEKTAPENSSKRYLEIYFCTLHTYRQLQHKITRLKKCDAILFSLYLGGKSCLRVTFINVKSFINRSDNYNQASFFMKEVNGWGALNDRASGSIKQGLGPKIPAVGYSEGGDFSVLRFWLTLSYTGSWFWPLGSLEAKLKFVRRLR